MDLHQRQQFDVLLETAAERYAARLEERHRGPQAAAEKLRDDPEGEGTWLSGFTEAFFADFLLDNPDGACFVLAALARRPMLPHRDLCEGLAETATVGDAAGLLARAVFAAVLRPKTLETLDRRAGYQSV